MRRDDKASYDGITKIIKGVHSAAAPIVLPRTQLAWADNIECRTDFMRPRNGWARHLLTFTGRTDACETSAMVQTAFEDRIFEGAIVFERFSQIVCMIGGHLFSIDPLRWTVHDVTPITSTCPTIATYDANANNRYRAWFCEAENWVIAQDGDSIPWIYDGTAAVRSDTFGINGKPQVPIGKAMCYAQGRLHVGYASGRAFVIGDIVGGDSGSAAYDFKDSVLYFTENDVINGGGSFSIPINAGLLTAFRPVAQIDTSMGQGPTQVFTTGAIFSLNLPTDRTTWQDVNFPIGTVSNVTSGMTSDRCTPNVNGDIWGRAPDGWRAFMVARRDFQAAWVNAPLSHEVSRAVDGDDEHLLEYMSAAQFDNRLLGTTRPYRVWDHGIAHLGLVQLEFEPVTSLSERNPLPVWLGTATGVRVLQVLTGNVQGVPRCFIFALSAANKIELWEVSKTATADNNGSAESPIQWSFETAGFSFQSEGGTGADPSSLPGRELWSLDGGKLFVDEIESDVSFTAYWKPDQDPCWHLWHSWSVCADVSPCPLPEDCSCPGRAQYRRPFWLPEPRDLSCDSSNDKPYHIGREFQVRFEIVGRCRVKMLELVAHAQEEDVTHICQASESCTTVKCIPPDDFAYIVPPGPTPPPVPTGACCINSQCFMVTEEECLMRDGTYMGDYVSCSFVSCSESPPALTGACCIGNECSIMTEADCLAAGGVYWGNDVPCEYASCSEPPPPRPANPEWPPPTSYVCEGGPFLWGAITIQDPGDGDTRFVGITPGWGVDPNAYLASIGAPGCLDAWCDEVWDQWLAAGIPYSQARLVWMTGILTGDNFPGYSAFPDYRTTRNGFYPHVIDLDTWITVEYCPLEFVS